VKLATSEILLMMCTKAKLVSYRFFLIAALIVAAQAAEARQAPASPAPGPSVEVPADYLIGPEDVLGVVFWREAEISGDVAVRPDGRVSLPMIGEMVAAGLRPQELQQRILVAAAKYINDPNVSVVVRTINSLKVFVTGRVTTPGQHPLKGPMTVMQVIALAGGVTEYADAKNISILRTVKGRTESFKFNYRDVSRGKKLEQNIMLKPGDTVVVP
jgi:polysaccharide biosynthesis/export protein